MTRKDLHRWLRRVWIVSGLAFMAWLAWNAQAHGLPPGTFESSSAVRVSRGPEATRFEPAAATTVTPGLVFLAGAAVDPDAYGPLARSVAELGFPVALVPLPYRLAPTEASRATLWRRIDAVITSWGQRPVLLGGHSRGAALAGRFAARSPGAIAGLILVATTHPRDEDLSSLLVPVVKVIGSRDCVAPGRTSRERAHLLPPQTRWMEIAGANHAQFGHYGAQLGDCGAEISRETQQRQVRGAIVSLLDEIGRASGSRPGHER